MDFFEIMMFVLGAVFFIVSFLVGNNQEGEPGVTEYQSEEEIEKIRQQLIGSINETAEQAITEAENRLSTMSNETILSVEDFSKQTLERIAHNHEEVVFMYHMLQTKEEDLKKMVLELENKKNSYKEPEIPLAVPEESGIEIARKKAAAAAQSKRSATAASKKAAAKATPVAVPAETEAAIAIDIPTPALSSEDEDSKNRRILELYKNKKSVLEISKQLGLGQGEVKLVIDLYGRL